MLSHKRWEIKSVYELNTENTKNMNNIIIVYHMSKKAFEIS